MNKKCLVSDGLYGPPGTRHWLPPPNNRLTTIVYPYYGLLSSKNSTRENFEKIRFRKTARFPFLFVLV